jgi:hypothetical protein
VSPHATINAPIAAFFNRDVWRRVSMWFRRSGATPPSARQSLLVFKR